MSPRCAVAAIGGAAVLVSHVAAAQAPAAPVYPAPGYPGPAYGPQWAPAYREPAPEPQEKARPRDEGAQSALMLRVGAGAFYTKIFAVTSYGGEGFFGIGSASKTFAWDGGMHVAKGTTLHGLGIWKWRAAFSFEWPIGVVRLGLGPSLGYLSMQSATLAGPGQRNEPLAQVSFGGELHASVDLFQLSRRDAIFARASFQLESGAYGPTLGLGYRWEAWTEDE